MTVIEAMGQGMPVLSTQTGEVLSFGRDRENILFLKEPLAKEITDKIHYLIKSPQEAKALGRAAQKTIEQLYSNEALQAADRAFRERLYQMREEMHAG